MVPSPSAAAAVTPLPLPDAASAARPLAVGAAKVNGRFGAECQDLELVRVREGRLDCPNDREREGAERLRADLRSNVD